jgi:hypothetical protein
MSSSWTEHGRTARIGSGLSRAEILEKGGADLSISRGPDRRSFEPTNQEDTMRYLLMIAGDESAIAGATQAEGEAMMAEYFAFGEEMSQRGVLLGGERLHFTSDATTVRVNNGEVLTTDGPFAETKEQLGGYYLVDCKDLDEAIEVASKIPGAKIGSVEVRPIWDM